MAGARRIHLHRILEEFAKVKAQLEAERARLEGAERKRLEALIARLEAGQARTRMMCPETQVLWESASVARKKPKRGARKRTR